MRRVANTNTLRIGIFGTWYSLWYDKEYYTFLVYKDYKLIEFLNSIFYRLRVPTSHFYLNRLNSNYYFIESNLYLTKPSFNKFTKLFSYNKLVFKYISLLEYLFDFSLLVSNNLLKDKTYIDDLLYKENNLIKSNYFLFYMLNSFKQFYKNEYIYYLYLYQSNIEKKIISNINKKNKQIINLFVNTININSNSFYGSKLKSSNEVGNIKSFFIRFFSFLNYEKTFFLHYSNLTFSYFKKKIVLFFLNYFIKFLSFYFFFTSFFNSLEKSIYYFLNFYYKFYFFIKKVNIYNLYKLNLYKNINIISLAPISNTLITQNKNSIFSYNSKLFLSSSKDSFKNKYFLNYKFNKFISSNLNSKYGFISYFYINSFNLLAKEFFNNSIKINREVVDMVYFKKINKLNVFQKKLLNHFKLRFFKLFNFYLEFTIFNYTGLNSFFLMSYYVKNFPTFDSKLISDYICFNLKRKHRITRVFNKISQIQKKLNFKSKKIFIPLFNEINIINNKLINKKYLSYYNYNNLFNVVFFNKIYNKDLSKKYNPLSGIRIEFSGPPKKAQMSKTVAYHNIIHDYKLVGKMPTHTVYADIHYYQSYVKLKRSTFGIKVWLFFHTRILNSNNVNKTIL